MTRRLRLLTWHVHGNYLYNLTQLPHEFYLVVDDERSVHHGGRGVGLPWGDHVHEAHVDRLAAMSFDAVIYQSRAAWEHERHRILSDAQRRLPRIYIEHDPPQQHPTDTRHWVDDPGAMLVHVTPFNALMWDSGRTPSRVIDHGVAPLAEARYSGEVERGLVVVNNLARRGRRLGLDVYEQVAREVPLSLAGMGSSEIGGIGEVGHLELPATMARHRFFFNPIRYSSLGLSVIEAMLIGVPIVGLATTELPSVIRSGTNGFIDTRVDRLVDVMQALLRDPALAREWGRAARRTALERFSIGRFVADWEALLDEVVR